MFFGTCTPLKILHSILTYIFLKTNILVAMTVTNVMKEVFMYLRVCMSRSIQDYSGNANNVLSLRYLNFKLLSYHQTTDGFYRENKTSYVFIQNSLMS